jgi:UDP-N-acetylmuramoyl-L-alanyl-D-glutamate--2,6-diaminopimelate ligase
MSFRGLVKKIIPSNFFHVSEPYGHLVEAIAFNAMAGFPARKLKVIGVTGTNGKTTTSFLIHRMLVEAGYKAGLMTTVAYGVGNDIKPQIHHMTNVPVPELMKRLKAFNAQGAEWLVLETTSQALAQNRVWGVPYSLVVMTNLTHEHLDYHKTFERYRDAKVKMFQICNRNHRGKRTGILNADDPSASYFANAIKHHVSYGIKGGDIRATSVKLATDGVSYQAKLDDREYKINCHIPGSFNVYNSLAVVAVGHQLGLTQDQIEKGIAALKGVEGRMTTIDEGQPFSVVVDFAHTPDSFEKLFKDLKPVVKGKLIVMFGSAGRRDEAKRGIQGRLAGKYADEVILTEEDDRDTGGDLILEDIAKGVRSQGKKDSTDLFLVHNRTEAINFAVNRAKSKDDMVLLLGKGHEKTIERSDGEHQWDEIGTAHTALKKLKV